MREAVKWTNLSRREIARQLAALGTPVCKDVVSQLFYNAGYRRRKPHKNQTMGEHVDRNAQFERIAQLKQEYLESGKPVISMDTKKKELLGNFYRDGVTDAVESTVVNDHDFASSGKVIPHGIYDVGRNEAALHLNLSHDTRELAARALACGGMWWNEQGSLHYLPYCSKYNPIEHRLFPHVTRACKGVPLETIETAKHYMEKTKTTL